MIDSDMKPDYPRYGAKPFVPGALDFALSHHGPCVIAAPYSGPSPHQNMYVFTWRNLKSNNPNPDMQVRQYEREEAAVRSGFEEVAALPTGLILIDMRVFSDVLVYKNDKGEMEPAAPYFYYEYTNRFNTHKASTEDVTFTRDCSLSGVPVYCNWDAWCGHWKNECVPPPVVLAIDDVREEWRKVILRGHRKDDALMQAGVRCRPRRSKPSELGLKKEKMQGVGDDNSGPSVTFQVAAEQPNGAIQVPYRSWTYPMGWSEEKLQEAEVTVEVPQAASCVNSCSEDRGGIPKDIFEKLEDAGLVVSPEDKGGD